MIKKEKGVTVQVLSGSLNWSRIQNATLNVLFERVGVKPNVVIRASQLYTIHNFIKHNLGGAFLYSSLLKNMPGTVGIPIVPTISQEIGLVWQKGNYINSSVEKYISFTKRYAINLKKACIPKNRTTGNILQLIN